MTSSRFENTKLDTNDTSDEQDLDFAEYERADEQDLEREESQCMEDEEMEDV